VAKVLVLYYSMYGHIETMAKAVVAGAESVDGASVQIMRVPELMEREFAKKVGAKLDQAAPIAKPMMLADYDAVIFGTPTRFGNMCSQMRNFLDQTGSLWLSGGLTGKIGSVFTSTGTGSGNETTITSFHNTLIHHGMLIAGVAPNAKAFKDFSELHAGSVYGASTLAGADGSRQPTEADIALAKDQGRCVAEYAIRMSTP
jgi:NAD(P)H dehydrogenase (quinone)